MTSISRPGLLSIRLIILLAVIISPVSAQISIRRPNSGVPEFAETGGVFRVEVKAKAGLPDTKWTAILFNDLRSWTGTVERAVYGCYVDNNTATGYQLKVRAPGNIPPETFNLVIKHPSAGNSTNRNAVGVVQNFETDFYILHYADPQAEAREPDNMNTGMYGSRGSIREIYWHAPAIKLINPRFVLGTGDELDNAFGTSVDRYNEYIAAMCNFGVPVMVTRGNNDREITTADWRNTLGIETYSITMGSFHVWQNDVREKNFMTWLKNDYTSSFTNTTIRYRLFGQHFDDASSMCPGVFRPPNGLYPDLMLIGHRHVNNIKYKPYAVVQSQQACNKGAVGFFEFSPTSSNWMCTTLPTPWFQVMDTGSVARIDCSFASINNGACISNTATINNKLPFTFRDGRIRFLMKYTASGYEVVNGTKLAEYDYNGKSNMAVVVRVSISKNAITMVKIQTRNSRQR